MKAASVPVAAEPPRLVRRIVLGTAFLLALTVTLAPRVPAVHAQESHPAAPAAPAAPKPPSAPTFSATVKDGDGATATIDIRTNEGGQKTVSKTIVLGKSAVPKAGDEPATEADSDAAAGPIVGVGPGRHGKRVRVGVLGDDREYDSFNDFAHNEPALAGMIIGIVAIVFLSPVLAIALILWYRMRKARMLNETMLKLAEKGIVPPAEALESLVGARGAAPATGSAAPIYEQAKQIQRRAAWSDLRKGVILGGIGLGLTSFSMLDDGTPNSVGLVLLFVGVGYFVLWWFEERQLTSKANGAGTAPPAPPSGGTGGGA